jgi:hypothetical protein
MRRRGIVLVGICAALLGAAAPANAIIVPTSVTFDPPAAAVGDLVMATVTLAVPADGVVFLQYGSPDVTGPSFVSIGGQSSVSFPVEVGARTAPSTSVTASDGSSLSATGYLTVLDPSASHAVINEIDYDQGSPDNAEFVEVYNPTTHEIDPHDLALSFVNGADSNEYLRVGLGRAHCIRPGGYVVVRSPGLGVAGGASAIDLSGPDAIQDGAPDGVALIDTSSNTLVDALSYEGSITFASIPGFAAPVSLVENTATSAVDTGSGTASLVRAAYGADTDNSAADWAVSSTPTPGADNTHGVAGAPPCSTFNRPPVIDPPVGNRSVAEHQQLSFTVAANDPEGDSVTLSADNLPQGATFDPGTGEFAWTPTYSQAGTYPNVRFIAWDGTDSSSEFVTLTVTNVDRPPVLGAIGDQTVPEGAPLGFTVHASDPDGDPLTFSASSLPSGAALNPATGVFSWTPTFSQAGAYPVHFVVADGSQSDSEDVTLTVTDVPQPQPQPTGPTPAPPTPRPAFSSVVPLPSAKTCRSKRTLKLKLKPPKGDAIAKVSVTVNGKPQKSKSKQTIDLRGLPKGTYRVKVTITLRSGQKLTGTRTYRTCAAKGKKHR